MANLAIALWMNPEVDSSEAFGRFARLGSVNQEISLGDQGTTRTAQLMSGSLTNASLCWSEACAAAEASVGGHL